MRPATLACAVAALVLTAAPARAERDPFEEVNRRIHAFNQEARAQVLGPLAEAYTARVPPDVQRGIARAFANLGEPVTALSGLAAGDLEVAARAATRFGINATLGLGGVRDPAAAMGWPARPFSVADAVCAWGVPSGPFLMLPLLGPSTLRDASAMAASGIALSQALGPEVVLAWRGGDAFVGYAGMHRDLAAQEERALDAYAVLRSAHLQRRAAACPADRAAAEGEEER